MAQQTSFLSGDAVLDGFLQPPVLTEQLDQLDIHVTVGWPRHQFSLQEVEQLVPALLPLTT